MTLVNGDGIGQNEWKLFPVHIKLFLYNELVLNLSMSNARFVLSNSTVTWCLWILITVPSAPLTKPCSESMFLRSITRAPTAIRNTASNPAVRLESLFSLSSVLSHKYWLG